MYNYKIAYSIAGSSFLGISSWVLLASNILRIDNLVHAAESALGFGEEDLHVLEWATSDQYTSIPIDRPPLRLDRHHIDHKSAISVLFEHLTLLDGVEMLYIRGGNLLNDRLQGVLGVIRVVLVLVIAISWLG